MKKKTLIMVMALAIGVFTMAGCGKDSKEAKEEAKTEVIKEEESGTEEVADVDVSTVGFEVFDYDVKEYVTLGDYKNLSVQYPVPVVSDEDVEMEASYLVDENTEYKDVERAAENGDCVNIDYTGTMNGEEFEGGSDTNYDLILGDGEFLEDFENNIVGKKAGESVTFKTTFPEDYYDDMAGKEVEFTITVNNVSEVVTPEYTDAFVAEVTEYDSIEAYEDSIREELMITAQEDAALMTAEDVLLKAVENATVNGYPQELYDVAYQDNVVTYESYAEMFGMEFDDFMTDFMGGETIESLTEKTIQELLVTQAIAEAEGFMLTEENYANEAETMVADYEYETLEELEADYGKFAVISTLLRDKTLNFLYESADVEEVSEDEYYGDEEDMEMLETEE